MFLEKVNSIDQSLGEIGGRCIREWIIKCCFKREFRWSAHDVNIYEVTLGTGEAKKVLKNLVII